MLRFGSCGLIRLAWAAFRGSPPVGLLTWGENRLGGAVQKTLLTAHPCDAWAPPSLAPHIFGQPLPNGSTNTGDIAFHKHAFPESRRNTNVGRISQRRNPTTKVEHIRNTCRITLTLIRPTKATNFIRLHHFCRHWRVCGTGFRKRAEPWMAEPERHMDVPKERFSETGPTHPPPKLKKCPLTTRRGLFITRRTTT